MKKILAMLVAATMILGMVNIFAVAETTATELSGLAPSVYLLQVTTTDGTTVRKVFVK